MVDVSCGGENGFNQAIELSAEIVSNVKFIQEKRLMASILRILESIYLVLKIH